jgi:chaperone required for assembly of F1-ATPase
MTAWAAKRFWTSASVVPLHPAGFTVHLDGRAVKTPAKNPLILPTENLAQLIADEWDAQTGLVRPETMPMTRRANSALEKVAPQREAVIAELARYGGCDLLCYRAPSPQELAHRQAASWQPLLDWAAQDLAAPLRVTTGINAVEQPPESLGALRAKVAEFDNFGLAGLHDLVAISGSLVLALATAYKVVSPETGFALSRIDEAWQAEHWGQDEEAAEHESLKKAAFCDAFAFLCAIK